MDKGLKITLEPCAGFGCWLCGVGLPTVYENEISHVNENFMRHTGVITRCTTVRRAIRLPWWLNPDNGVDQCVASVGGRTRSKTSS